MILFLSLLINKTKNKKLSKLNEYPSSKISKRELIFKITLAAVFMALAIVLKSFSITTGQMRLGFYEIPVVLSGMALGPLFGSLVGLGSDLIYSLSSGYSFSPIMMCSAIMWGFIGSLFYKKHMKLRYSFLLCLVASVLATTINSLQLYIYYGMGMVANLPNRILTMIVKWPIISISAWLLYERVLKKVITKITKSKKITK